MNAADIAWMAPWRAVADADEARGLERQLRREIGFRHPLRGKRLEVIGRRVDNDDVVAVLPDGTYVNVHPVWSQGALRRAFSRDYPSWYAYGPTRAFVAAMTKDAALYASE